ncbi:MAG: hypothetical protein HGN29_00840 [Asgard group archaeon]|nr:hypothetical protein [Asgard group archaeon]
MVKTKNVKLLKNRKNVKEIAIKKKLEREIEEILSQQITANNDSKDGIYSANGNSILRKDKRN